MMSAESNYEKSSIAQLYTCEIFQQQFHLQDAEWSGVIISQISIRMLKDNFVYLNVNLLLYLGQK